MMYQLKKYKHSLRLFYFSLILAIFGCSNAAEEASTPSQYTIRISVDGLAENGSFDIENSDSLDMTTTESNMPGE